VPLPDPATTQEKTMARTPSPWTEYSDCPTYDRPVAVYNPKDGDGSIRITRWHKRWDPDGYGQWCRAEVDYGQPGVDLRRTRLPAA
jgi:hypothetical protein